MKEDQNFLQNLKKDKINELQLTSNLATHTIQVVIKKSLKEEQEPKIEKEEIIIEKTEEFPDKNDILLQEND